MKDLLQAQIQALEVHIKELQSRLKEEREINSELNTRISLLQRDLAWSFDKRVSSGSVR
jgi:peptidoglycan hydrolase CwlO-like protein